MVRRHKFKGDSLSYLKGTGFGVQSSGFGVQGTGFGVQGSGFGVQGSGLTDTPPRTPSRTTAYLRVRESV